MLCVRVWLLVVLVWFGFDFALHISHLTALRMGGSHSMPDEALPPRQWLVYLFGVFISWPRFFGLNSFEPYWFFPTFASV